MPVPFVGQKEEELEGDPILPAYDRAWQNDAIVHLLENAKTIVSISYLPKRAERKDLCLLRHSLPETRDIIGQPLVSKRNQNVPKLVSVPYSLLKHARVSQPTQS